MLRSLKGSNHSRQSDRTQNPFPRFYLPQRAWSNRVVYLLLSRLRKLSNAIAHEEAANNFL